MKKMFFLFNLFLKFTCQSILLLLKGLNSCCICGNPCGIFYVCENCKNTYFSANRIFSLNRCNICGKELISTQKTCNECREKQVLNHVDMNFSLLTYRLWNKEIVFLWKTKDVRILSLFFSGILKNILNRLNQKFIIPVPPRPGKLTEKGWDQIDEICKILEFKYHFTILRLLERKSTNQQKKLNRENRLTIIGKGYNKVSIDKIKKEIYKNKNQLPEEVCLLDDVCTTGATVESCSAILKEIGIKTVNVVTIFKVD